MNLEKDLIFRAIVGSQAFGTNTETSDTDYCGIYQQSTDEILGFNYIEQLKLTKDEYYFEVKRFLQLLSEAKPNALELLNSPSDCIVYKSPVFDLIYEKKDLFITQQCYKTFGNYALAQINKATGQDKKINWDKEKVERKKPFDFAYVTFDGKSQPLTKYLEENNLLQEYCGLVHLKNFKNTFALYYDHLGSNGLKNPIGFRGIIKDGGDEFRTSSIPQDMKPLCTVYYNSDGYSMHCKDYQSYSMWKEERNEARYLDNANHNQPYDSKNMMHCRRLLDVAIEIATEGNINVRRKNIDYLLSIKRGEPRLKDIIDKAKEDIDGLKSLYEKSSLPLTVDMKEVNDLLIKIRRYGL